MAKPLRSPVVGYNHNVRYHGRVFHVQSEDSGPVIPRVFTHLFYEGTILVTRKHEYDVAAHEDLVRIEMQKLHKSVIKELTRGEHDVKIAGFFAARGQPAILPDPSAPAQEPAPAASPVQVVPPVAAPAPSAAMAAAHASVNNGAPAAVVVHGSGMVGGGAASGDPRVVVPRPGGTRPQGIPRSTGTPVLKPGDLKRPPVVLSSSADGVVVQRNVVIGVGGPSTPGPVRPARIRPPVPYVVREGSYAPATSAGGHSSGHPGNHDGHSVRPMASGTPSPAPIAKGGHAGITWDTAPVAGGERRGPTPQSERSFGNELVSDKSLDEVILEYLSDDSEADES